MKYKRENKRNNVAEKRELDTERRGYSNEMKDKVVVNCFLLTAVYGQAVAGVLENKRVTEQFKQVFEDMDMPYSYGKITGARY